MRRVLTVFPATLLSIILLHAGGALPGAAGSLPSVTVSVDTSRPGVKVPAAAIGLNTAVWDSHLRDRAIPSLLRAIGVRLLRYPGGSTSDDYHWQTHTLSSGGADLDPATAFDYFMTKVAGPTGAGAMVTVNYGSNAKGTGGGSQQEAAAWVRHAATAKALAVRYWEIGNEIYGNGFYGAKWETDLHADHSPAAYAANALAYIRAMKAADASAQVGVVLAAPGQWPDGQPPQDWNSTVLAKTCAAADFVSVHWYPQQPGQESDAGLLGAPDSIPGMVKGLHDLFAKYCGGHTPRIMVTEMNSVSSNPGKQSTSPINALFLVDSYAAWLQAGVQSVSWWDLHNGAEHGNNNSAALAGKTKYGDYGVLSSGDPGEGKANTPQAAYWGLALLHAAVLPGAHFLPVQSTGEVRAYALRRPDKSVAGILVNRSGSALQAHLAIEGFRGTRITATTYSLASPRLVSVSVRRNQVRLGPYSVTVVTVR